MTDNDVEGFFEYIDKINEWTIVLGGLEPGQCIDAPLDLFITPYKLAINFCSVYNDKMYNLSVTEKCLEKDITLFNIFPWDNIDVWQSMINGKLNLNNKVYARKCTIKELSSKDVSQFLSENHLQGHCQASVNLGLYYNSELLEVMNFAKPRFNKKYDWELIRLCTKKYTTVVGGASKLFKYFVDKYQPKNMISYANRRFSRGNVYRQLGFTELEPSGPNYFYLKGDEVLTRNACQKFKLLKKYGEEYAKYTEIQIMRMHGYEQLYDCGNLVFVKSF